MNKSLIITIVITLVLGTTMGYIVGGSQTHPTDSTTSVQSSSMPANHMTTSEVSELKDKSGDALDAAFLDGMIAHHQQAIDMANVVLTRTKRPEIKQMAQDIISAQTKEIETMQGWLKAWFGR